jgi:hypothetical protein
MSRAATEATVTSSSNQRAPSVQNRMLVLATIGFLINFWAWALISPLGVAYHDELGLVDGASSWGPRRSNGPPDELAELRPQQRLEPLGALVAEPVHPHPAAQRQKPRPALTGVESGYLLAAAPRTTSTGQGACCTSA